MGAGVGTEIFSTNVGRLISNRLRLRPTERADSELLNGWANSAEGARWFVDCLPRSIEALSRRFEETLNDDHDERFIIHLNSGKDVGIVGLRRSSPHHAEIDIAILDDDARGHGFGQEALRLIVDASFLMYPLERVQCVVDEKNDIALNFFIRFGFVNEGRLRHVAFRDGVWRDSVLLSLLRSEWAASRGIVGQTMVKRVDS